MASIKEIAEKTGFSLSTVSAVLGGKAEERRITEETARTIHNAAKSLGYMPNVAARRLKSNSLMTHIALYVPMDYNPEALISFIRGFRDIIAENDHLEFSLKFYTQGELSKAFTPQKVNMLNAAIIFNVVREDVKYLDDNTFNIPIILNSPSSKKYPCVTFDGRGMTETILDVFISRGHRDVLLLVNDDDAEWQAKFFAPFFERRSISLLDVISVHDSFGGGEDMALKILEGGRLPSCIFSYSYRVSCGLISRLLSGGVRIPEDLELICIGGENDYADSYVRPLPSKIAISDTVMAKYFYEKMMDMLSGKDVELVTVYPVRYIPRDTCGPML